jgi:hypothetical protein
MKMPYTIVRAQSCYVCTRCDEEIKEGEEYIRQGSLPFHLRCFRAKIKESLTRYRETLEQLDRQV